MQTVHFPSILMNGEVVCEERYPVADEHGGESVDVRPDGSIRFAQAPGLFLGASLRLQAVASREAALFAQAPTVTSPRNYLCTDSS